MCSLQTGIFSQRLCLLFSLNIYDIDLIAEGVEGAIAGSSTVRVTHMLYADDVPNCKEAKPTANHAQSFGRVCQEERVNHQYR